MALRINPFSRINNDTGFGSNSNSYVGRFINRDGTFNLRKEGIPVWERVSIYHTLLNLPAWKFFFAIIFFFVSINLVYTLIYLALGANEFQGILGTSKWQVFREIYFFSTETFTTVGYGRVNPIGDGANLVASIEALNGFLYLAVFTGLIYGRFSKPKAFLKFSDHAVIAPYKDKMGLMFRFASFKDMHTLTDVEVKTNIALLLQEDGKTVYRFYELPLERSRIQNLPMNWTVVHPIDADSPLLDLNEEDIKAADVEIYVTVRGFDDVFSNFVLKRTSYTWKEIQFNRRFVPMYRETGNTTVLELQKLNTTVPAEAKKEAERLG
ncbi:ion channel [Chitinophaga sp. CF418]|uniref:ion channel n=1 Tax=Chitinophaga sp. CF418 TaxID=1855287 RepID=UPI00091DCE3F|nr:ion channel [Chitinophaga sp. CF418]SHN23834.1 inward rectifier potassium channel [Chitinophaga sp. CF418]